MQGTPNDWNINIRGAWNLAILTPAGVAKRLFGLDPGTPIEIAVVVDQPGSFLVSHNGITVAPGLGRILVSPANENTVEMMALAAQVAARALESLPETPVTAAGVNIRYMFESLPDSVIRKVRSELDDQFADADRTTVNRRIRWCLQRGAGVVNAEVLQSQDSSGIVSFNFHRHSEGWKDLVDWVLDIENMVPEAENLLAMILA